MPRILTTCPTTGALAPTGHRTGDLDLALLSEPRSFRCPLCEKVHDWTAREAVVEATLSLAAFRAA